MARRSLQLFRGPKDGMPALLAGEPGWCTDTRELYIGTDGTIGGNAKVGGDGGGVVTEGYTGTIETVDLYGITHIFGFMNGVLSAYSIDTPDLDITLHFLGAIYRDAITVVWFTNIPATGEVVYREHGDGPWIESSGSDDLINQHTYVITGLSPGVVYDIKISSESGGEEPDKVSIVITGKTKV